MAGLLHALHTCSDECMRKAIMLSILVLMAPTAVLAWGGHYQSRNYQHHDSAQHPAHKQGHSTGNTGSRPSAPVVPVPNPATTPPVVTPPAPGETRFIAYTTGYGYPDNTPPSAEISNPVLHSSAGGTGTYADPITIAVGHTLTGGKDILDYPEGTRFYVPDLRRYFIVEDTCGDGNSPQNGPCHTGYQGHVWLDEWVGGTIAQTSATLACEDAITDLHMVIENPASNYVVVAGPVFNGSCAAHFGDAIITQ